MPAKTKTAKTKAKKTTKTKTTTGRKKAVKKTTTKKTTAKKKTPSKKKPAAKKKSTAKKTATKKKAAPKKKTTRKKSSSRSKATPTIHRSEYISPMTVTPFDAGPSFSHSIDLNDMPSVVDNEATPFTDNVKVLAPALTSRLSFYMGIFFGAIVLHALMISVLAVMSV